MCQTDNAFFDHSAKENEIWNLSTILDNDANLTPEPDVLWGPGKSVYYYANILAKESSMSSEI